MVAPTCQAQAWMLLAGHLAHKMTVQMKTQMTEEQLQQQRTARHSAATTAAPGIGSKPLAPCRVLSWVSRVRLFAIPGSSVHGILQAPILEWAAIHTRSCPGPQFQLDFPPLLSPARLQQGPSLVNISSSPCPNPGTYCNHPLPWVKCSCERCMGVTAAEKRNLEGVGAAWYPSSDVTQWELHESALPSWGFLLCPRENTLWLNEKC